MIIRLVYFLYIYYAFLAIWAVLFLVGIYHLLRFGFKNFTTLVMTFLFITIAALMLWSSFGFIQQVDWNTEITTFSGISNNPSLTNQF
jgi:hypothetical protein